MRRHPLSLIVLLASLFCLTTFGSVAAQVGDSGDGGDLLPVRKQFPELPFQPWKHGFINLAGQLIVETRWANAMPFQEGLSRVLSNSGDWGFIGSDGEIVIEPTYRGAADFSEGLAQVLIADARSGKMKLLTGFIDPTGRMVIEARFDYERDRESLFHEGLACVAVDGSWGYIDTQGNFLIPPRFEIGGDFSEGLAAVLDDGKWSYIDQAGDYVVKPIYDHAGDFSEGLAWVQLDDKAGCIDTTGEIVVELRFDALPSSSASDSEFSEGLSPATLNSKVGFIDRQGQFVIEPRFDFAGRFSEGRARIAIDRRFGFVDATGVMVIDPQYIDALDYENGFAFVTRNTEETRQRFAYIDEAGEVFWESE